jgi:hypothetical protein
MSMKERLDLIRWLLASALTLLGIAVAGMNAKWAAMARNEDRRGPSLVPLVSPILGMMAAIIAPRWEALGVVPILAIIDRGTRSLLCTVFCRLGQK